MIESQSKQRLASVTISPEATIAKAVVQLDAAGTGALALCDSEGKFVGLLTDGDVRRALLQSKSFDAACSTIATREPVVASQPFSVTEAILLMNRHDINQLPLLGSGGRLEGFILRRDLTTVDALKSAAQHRLETAIISPDATFAEAIARVDKAGTGALVLCREGRKLCGLLTDGDIRRAVLNRLSMSEPCGSIASANPITAQKPVSAGEALLIMNQREIDQLPVLDAEGNVIEFLLRKDLVGDACLGLSAVIMAGGYGKRMLPLTEKVPKPMLPIGDRPLLELAIGQLRRAGIQNVNLTTHYLPEVISDHFGDGQAFGVKLNYLQEDNPLGTAGGLKRMKKPDSPFIVINGDILTGVPFDQMLNYHRKHGAVITVGVRKYDIDVPFGVLECEDVRVTSLREKPSLSFFINAGTYLLEPSALDYIPEGRRFDMTDLIQKLLEEGRRVISFPIMEYWRDVGRQEDYRQAQEDVRKGTI